MNRINRLSTTIPPSIDSASNSTPIRLKTQKLRIILPCGSDSCSPLT